jgi:ubiquinone/menaquinone biosynthesis C-methylase UbiE
MTNSVIETTVEEERLRAVKTRQQAMWSSGDYAVIGTTLQIVGETLSEAADIRAVDTVLDVAAGNGNATLAAARRFATVVSTDYVPELLERGRRRAEAEGLRGVTFEVADAEQLSYRDSQFDVVLSTFGVMFAPNHRRAAAEMLRVCKPAVASRWRAGRPRGSSVSCCVPSAPMLRLRLASSRR